MDDKCPHCGTGRKPYLMSRRATERVLSTETILWIIFGAVVLVALTAHA